jgi:TPR repeat protein
MRQQSFLFFMLGILIGANVNAASYRQSDVDTAVRAYEQKDYRAAVPAMTRLSEQGHPGAQAVLGRMYLYGEGIAKNPQEGLRWLEKSADQGYEPAMFSLGNIYSEGRAGAKDTEKAAHWFRQSAARGSERAKEKLRALGVSLTEPEAANEKPTEPVKEKPTAVAQVSANAEISSPPTKQAKKPKQPQIVEAPSATKAEKSDKYARWQEEQDRENSIRMAAGRGDAEAQFQMALQARDDRESARWYRLAADQGHVDAQFRIGEMYALGEGVRKDEKEAARWRLQAAAQGYMLIQNRRAGLQRIAVLPSPKENEAFLKLHKAAGSGDAKAQRALGDMYAMGRGISKNDEEALAWYRLAADRGDAGARKELARRELAEQADYGNAISDPRGTTDKRCRPGQNMSQECQCFIAGAWFSC